MNKGKDSKNGKLEAVRSWNLMLVDDHGRIIPFRRFRSVAVAAAVLAMVSVAVIIVLGFMYGRQSRRLQQLASHIEELQQQASKLRDERDILLAQTVIHKVPAGSESSVPANAKDIEKTKAGLPGHTVETDAERSAVAAGAAQPSEIRAEPSSALASAQNGIVPQPVEPPAKAIEAAELDGFKADYYPKRAALKAVFRIHNTSRPKKHLSGRVVAVFKNSGQDAAKWVSIPAVDLVKGVPNGKAGKSFRIRNYMTIDLQAHNQLPPMAFDTVAVYVFSEEGNLIQSQDFNVSIDYQSPPAVPAANSEADSKPAAGQAEPAQQPNNAIETGTAAQAPSATDSSVTDSSALQTGGAQPGQAGDPLPPDGGSPAAGSGDSRSGSTEKGSDSSQQKPEGEPR